jgi:heptosyltransferase II
MKILLVQTSFLGDTILSTPVISGIKSIYPASELWIMTTPLSAHLVKHDPLLKGIIAYDKRKNQSGLTGLLKMAQKLKKMKFERVYSLHRSFRTSMLLWFAKIPYRIGCRDARLSSLYHETRCRDFSEHDVIRNLSILNGELDLSSFDMEMRLFAPPEDEIRPDILKKTDSSKPYAVIAPGSVWNTKMWFAEGFRSVAVFLLKQGYRVVLVGAKSDETVCKTVAQDLDVLNFAGRTDISDTMYIVKHAKLVVCNDSMTLHMASAFKIPNVAVFCATSPEFGYGPWKNNAIVVEKQGLHCKPCRPHGSVKCPEGTDACMKELPPDEVIKAIQKVLAMGDGS